MKLLLLSLVLLSSCGKHSSPSAQNNNDSDVDGRRDSHDKNPYVADMDDMGKLKGSMRFFGRDKSLSLNISNLSDHENNFIDLLTKSRLKTFIKKHDADVSLLSIEKVKLPVLDMSEYLVELRFAPQRSGKRPTAIAIKTDGQKKILSTWSDIMNVKFTREQIEDLMAGSSTLHAVREIGHEFSSQLVAEKQLHKNTYQVFVHNGASSKVFNVAKKLDFQKFRASLGAKYSSQVRPQDLLFNEASEDKSWWHTKIGTDYVLAYTSPSELKIRYLSGFEKKDIISERINGRSQSSSIVQSSPGSYHFLKVTAKRMINTFANEKGSVTEWKNGLASGCRFIKRSVKSQKAVELENDFFPDEFKVNIDDVNYSLRQLQGRIEYDKSEKAWKIAFESVGYNVQYLVTDRPIATFTQVGNLNIKCSGKVEKKPQRDLKHINLENALRLKVDSFVEKLAQ